MTEANLSDTINAAAELEIGLEAFEASDGDIELRDKYAKEAAKAFCKLFELIRNPNPSKKGNDYYFTYHNGDCCAKGFYFASKVYFDEHGYMSDQHDGTLMKLLGEEFHEIQDSTYGYLTGSPDNDAEALDWLKNNGFEENSALFEG